MNKELEELIEKCMLTKEEVDELWEEYERVDPGQDTPWSEVISRRLLTKAIPIIEVEFKEQWIKEGRREVVKWLKERPSIMIGLEYPALLDEWNKQLQEWGIDK